MGIGGYKIRHQSADHFISFAVVDWVDVFTREVYRNIVLESIRHCQLKRGLNLHAWCLMTNHLHLLASAINADLSDIVRDFKKHTSRQLISAISSNEHESRKGWMLPIFKKHGAMNARNGGNQLWRQDNQPKECYSAGFTTQKVDYIHRNPVAAGIVDEPHYYRYSSARDYFYGKKCGLLDVQFL